MDDPITQLLSGLLDRTLHLKYTVTTKTSDAFSHYLNQVCCGIFQPETSRNFPLMDFFLSMVPGTIYGISDRFSLYHLAFLLPDSEKLILIGPCLLEEPTDTFIASVLTRNHMDLQSSSSYLNFYKQWPVLNQAVIHTIGRIIGTYFYDGRPLDHRYFHAQDHPLIQPVYVDDAARILKMKTLEQQYEYEKKLLEAVSQGQRREAFDLFAKISSRYQGLHYTSDSLRNAKDSCIAFHTKLCSAAEQGGVHPIHLEETTVRFSSQIEKAQSVQEIQVIVQNMLRCYIQLVRKMAVPKCSSSIRKAVKLIHLGLSAPLSVQYIADMIQVHPDYLSRAFKKEMGISMIEYINKQRIIQSTHYLTETELPIRDIALYVGFEDINYYSRVFKRYVNCSPSQYRKTSKGQLQVQSSERAQSLKAKGGSEIQS